MYEAIQKMLKRSRNASDMDKYVFTRYVTKEISLEECYELFKQNNDSYGDVDLNLFKNWLKSLGWEVEK